MYEDSIENLKTRKPVEKRTVRTIAQKEQAAKDYYASVRTNVRGTKGPAPGI
jgi:chitin synthase